MAISTNKNVIINRKTSSNSYTELLPQEQASAITFNNENDLSTGTVGDGSFTTKFKSESFYLGTQSLFFLNDTIYASTGSTPTISVFRRYALRDGEYFTDVSSYNNTTNAFLLTNMGRVYNSSGTLVYDYRTILSLSDTVRFYSLSWYGGTTTLRPFVLLICDDGLYYNTTGEYSTLTKLDTTPLSLESNDFKYGGMINVKGVYYCIGFTISDIVQMPLSKANEAVFSKNILSTSYGDFISMQNNVVIGNAGVWFATYSDAAITVQTSGYTSVTPIDVGYGGYIFNDSKYNVVHLRTFKNADHNLSDLVQPQSITTLRQHCVIFLLYYSAYILGITQDGTIYKITKS